MTRNKIDNWGEKRIMTNEQAERIAAALEGIERALHASFSIEATRAGLSVEAIRNGMNEGRRAQQPDRR